MPDKNGKYLFIGGSWDGAYASLSLRNSRQKFIVTVDPAIYNQHLDKIGLGISILSVIGEDDDVLIYQRFEGRYYYQRTCKNKDVAKVIGIESGVFEYGQV